MKACCVLHTFLTEKKDIATIYNRLNPDGNPYLTDDGAIIDIRDLHGYHSANASRGIRDIYRVYFNRPEGGVPWQERAIY